MKKSCFIVLLLTLLLFPSLKVSANGIEDITKNSKYENYMISLDTYTYVRKEPNSSSKLIYKIPYGESYIYLNETKNGWNKIEYNGKIGYTKRLNSAIKYAKETYPRYINEDGKYVEDISLITMGNKVIINKIYENNICELYDTETDDITYSDINYFQSEPLENYKKLDMEMKVTVPGYIYYNSPNLSHVEKVYSFFDDTVHVIGEYNDWYVVEVLDKKNNNIFFSKKINFDAIAYQFNYDNLNIYVNYNKIIGLNNELSEIMFNNYTEREKTNIGITNKLISLLPEHIIKEIYNRNLTIVILDEETSKIYDNGIFNYKSMGGGYCLNKIYISDTYPQCLLHELGHWFSEYNGIICRTSEFVNIFESEVEAFYNHESLGDKFYYVKTNSTEYFASAFEKYFLVPEVLEQECPLTYKYIDFYIKKNNHL